MTTPERLDPATSGLDILRAIQLRHRSIMSLAQCQIDRTERLITGDKPSPHRRQADSRNQSTLLTFSDVVRLRGRWSIFHDLYAFLFLWIIVHTVASGSSATMVLLVMVLH